MRIAAKLFDIEVYDERVAEWVDSAFPEEDELPLREEYIDFLPSGCDFDLREACDTAGDASPWRTKLAEAAQLAVSDRTLTKDECLKRLNAIVKMIAAETQSNLFDDPDDADSDAEVAANATLAEQENYDFVGFADPDEARRIADSLFA